MSGSGDAGQAWEHWKAYFRRAALWEPEELYRFNGALKKSLTFGLFAFTLTRSKGFASRLRSKLDVPLRRTRP
jgi:hypothetical protein